MTGTCSAHFLYGTALTLTATPDPGNVFTGWSGACTGTGPCVITVNGAKSVTATFAAGATLGVTITGSGSGTVNSVPGGIACGPGAAGTCSAGFTSGATVTLTPAPSTTDSVFGGWSGACTTVTGDCVVTINAAKAVTATFNLAPNAIIQGAPGSYVKLQNAYASVATGGVIQARASEFIENLLLNRAIAITLKGGYDPGFMVNPGVTVIRGTLTLRSGSLVAEKLMVR